MKAYTVMFKYLSVMLLLSPILQPRPAQAGWVETCRLIKQDENFSYAGRCSLEEDPSIYQIPAAFANGKRLEPIKIQVAYRRPNPSSTTQLYPFSPKAKLRSYKTRWNCYKQTSGWTASPPAGCKYGTRSEHWFLESPNNPRIVLKASYPNSQPDQWSGSAIFNNGWEEGEMTEYIALCLGKGVDCGYK